MSIYIWPLCCFVWLCLLCVSGCQARNMSICIDDRDCTSHGYVCLQSACIQQSAIQCPDTVVTTAGEEVLVSYMQPVTISPPGGTCGEDLMNNTIDITFESYNPSTIHRSYRRFFLFADIDNPNVNPEYHYGPIYDFDIPDEIPMPPVSGGNVVSQTCGIEETVCAERHPRDQKLMVHVADRQTIGGPQCPTESTTEADTQASPGSGFTDGRRRRQAGEVPDAQSCIMKIGENIPGPTGNATIAMRFKLRNTAVQVHTPMTLANGSAVNIKITEGTLFLEVYNSSDDRVEISLPRPGVWYHLVVQFGYFYAEGGGHLWLSVFLGGRYQDSIEIISHQIAWETWTLLPLTIRNLYGDSTSFKVEDVRFYNKTLTNREIYELYSGEFQDLDVFSDCLCPNTHPSAITNHTGLDLYCAQNNNDLNILRRDNPLEGFSEAVGLYLPEFLTDGMALPIADLSTPLPLYAAWFSTPGVDPVIITVELQGTTRVSRIRLVSITPRPEGHITLSAGQQGQWTPFFMFLGDNNLQMETDVPSQPFSWYTLFGPPYISQWSYNMSSMDTSSPVPMDSVRITITGNPLWQSFFHTQRKRRQAPAHYRTDYHALSEIQVFGISPGCTCYTAGAAAGGMCESANLCQCRSDLDPRAGEACRPYVSSVSRLFGPESGGTVITIQGQLLAELESVLIGNRSCVIRRRSASHVTCRVASAPSPLYNQSEVGYNISISHGCSEVLGRTFQFQYRRDPVVQRIAPRRSFLDGGIVQTVSGRHFDSVASPFMLVYVYDARLTRRRKRQATGHDYFLVEIDETLHVQDNDGLYAILTVLCHPLSPTVMHCPTPPFPPPEGYPFSKSPGDVDQPPVYDVDVYVGFWLDGVETYHDMRDVDPGEAEILIYYDPVLQHFPEPQRIRAFKPYAPHNHDTIEIVGNKLQSGCDKDDYKVTVGQEECPVTDLDATTMYCRPPAIEPRDDKSIYGAPRVKVTLGYRYEQYTIGYLDYTKVWQSTEFYIGIVVAVAVLIIIIILLVVCLKLYFQAKSKSFDLTVG